jgi:hypothetical protein
MREARGEKGKRGKEEGKRDNVSEAVFFFPFLLLSSSPFSPFPSFFASLRLCAFA